MTRSAKKLGADVVVGFRRILKLERELQRNHAEGNWDAAWRTAVELQRAIGRSERSTAAFLESVSLPGIVESEGRNPGSG